jgi:hypothetical protein
MNQPDDFTIRVTNWPSVRRTTEVSLDRGICPDEDRLRAWCEDHYGRGALTAAGDGTWQYSRAVRGPAFFWDLFSFVLNKSYR